MRAKHWWQEASIIDDLITTPTSYGFVQATRLLRHRPDTSAQYWANDFKFHSSLNLNFPLAEIESFSPVHKSLCQITSLLFCIVFLLL